MRQLGKGLAVALLLLPAAAVSLADTLSVPIEAVTVIQGGIRGEVRSRILLKFAVPEALRRASVDFAGAIFDNPAKTFASEVTVHARPVTTAWNPRNVTWGYPWRTPGGDYDSVKCFSYILKPGDTLRAVLDFTDDVHSWQRGSMYNGTIVMRPGREGGGFGEETQAIRAALQRARVKLYFTR